MIGFGDHPGLRRHLGAGIGQHGGKVGGIGARILEAARIDAHVLVDERDAVVPFERVRRVCLGLELLGQAVDLGLEAGEALLDGACAAIGGERARIPGRRAWRSWRPSGS